MAAAPLLIIFGGLPGSGKTTISRALAAATGAVHLRIDTIEQALRRSGELSEDLGAAGYIVAWDLARDLLRMGHLVIGDSVNPIAISRQGWRAAATGVGAPFVEVEIVCSDSAAHRERVETRVADIPGLRLPTWQKVLEREYETWPEAIRVDTAGRSVEDALTELLETLTRLQTVSDKLR